MLKNVRIKTADSLLIRDEYVNAIRLVRLGIGLQSYTQFRGNLSTDEEKSQLKVLKESGNQYLDENHRLWLLRNKPGGYERSTAALNTLMLQIDERIVLLNKSPLTIAWNRLLEKIGTAGAVLYLR